MFRNLHDKFFPTPDFLTVPCFGLDIADESLKFIELINSRSGIKVGRHGERKIPLGIIESGKIKDLKRMGEILTSLRKEEKIKAVRVSLPEEQVYSFRLRLEKEGLEDIREGIEFLLEEHVPIPAQDAIFDYQILAENAQSFDIQVAAVQKNIIEDYISIFRNSNILVKSFELEAQAIARAVVKRDDPETYMVVDFGEKRSGVCIVSDGAVMFTSTVDVGGMILTNMIQKSFKISYEEAEKMKRKYGLQRNVVNREMFAVLLNSVSILRDEIEKHFLYWHTHIDENEENRPTIKKIILCGGDANLIGLAEYFSVSIKCKVEIANVWINILDVEKRIPDISFDQSLTYATALGLVLGDFVKN